MRYNYSPITKEPAMSTSNIRVANIARAKIIYNKNKETYKIIIAFNVFPRENDQGDIVYPFPTQVKCDFVSGDIAYETIENDKIRIIEHAKQQLRTDNIEFV
jgi:hypothetical protein